MTLQECIKKIEYLQKQKLVNSKGFQLDYYIPAPSDKSFDEIAEVSVKPFVKAHCKLNVLHMAQLQALYQDFEVLYLVQLDKYGSGFAHGWFNDDFPDYNWEGLQN